MILHFTLNGQATRVECDPDRRVVDLLRQDLGLTGVKEACGAGECGACAILLDGVPRLSCLLLAAQLAGHEVLTIEGLAGGEAPHPLQEAFARAGAVQCGFCTPGMVLASHALLARQPRPSRQEIAQAIAGNLCRCTGYHKIIDAVRLAAGLSEDDS
ncbi:MAG: (2Fe-2S)-binding protein [Desulfarculus sp.]|nr:(2Fe-2S)-binding protein [Desulfarculus sp.]